MNWEFNEADDGKCGAEQVEPPIPPAVYDGDSAVCWLNDGEVSAEDVEKRGLLLAAAPNLLAACKRLVAALESLTGYDYTIYDADDAMEAAAAAIAKAEGGQS